MKENPFKNLIAQDAPPSKKVESEVMGHVHTKFFILSLIEFFTAIFGFSLSSSVIHPHAVVEEVQEEVPHEPKARKKSQHTDQPDYFF
ncbi:MAG: hypothetical protein D6730_07015 [Bacteroidetes bacterium]|nr:MAG: hypothetical protein D6730_07015 [Bacteroidota bacterium]